jgi:Ser/Thr protein kinase RdoA (MazF antagonist)
LAFITSTHGAAHRIRLVSWIEGQPLAETNRSDAALESLGRMLGRFDAALKGFIHPGALRDLDWDIRKAGRSARRTDATAEDRACSNFSRASPLRRALRPCAPP